MSLSRRKFLALGCKTIWVIGAGHSLQSFAARGFIAPNPKDIALRFAVVSDGHYGQPETDYTALHEQMKQWLNSEHRENGLDFSFINGDLFHNDRSFLPAVKKFWDGLEMPYYISRGNHDQADKQTWESTWQIPLNYSFEKKDAAFVVLDTANEKGEYICPDIDWAKKELRQYENKKQLFVFMNITPFNWTKGGNACPLLVDVFNKQTNLKAIFHGHDHDQDGVKENAGKFYFFDAHIAGNWGTDYRGYRMVEILKNGAIISYQVNPSKKINVNNQSF